MLLSEIYLYLWRCCIVEILQVLHEVRVRELALVTVTLLLVLEGKKKKPRSCK
jgi:hypothetical protein